MFSPTVIFIKFVKIENGNVIQSEKKWGIYSADVFYMLSKYICIAYIFSNMFQ